jgi:hypothetical protein
VCHIGIEVGVVAANITDTGTVVVCIRQRPSAQSFPVTEGWASTVVGVEQHETVDTFGVDTAKSIASGPDES